MTRPIGKPEVGVGVRLVPGTVEIGAHADVKSAAKNWALFSSHLLGDVDVRTYHQLPLELDPPSHEAYRTILAPVFGRQEVAVLEPQLRLIARRLVADLVLKGSVDAVYDLALPMVVESLGVAYGRPQDVEELRRWGVRTWQLRADGTREGSVLDDYLARVFDEVATHPGPDVFSRVAAATINGRKLSRIECLGVGNLIMGAGRDTVVVLIAGAIWHLAGDRAGRIRLTGDPGRIRVALEELLRFLSPLRRMERIATEDIDGPWGRASAGEIVLLDFARANHDPTAYSDPDVIILDRSPNPHVAFGNGPHTCIGVHLARLEARVFLEEFLAAVPTWRVREGARIVFEQVRGAQVPVDFDALPIEVVA